ncbi:MAG: cytochrome [Tardiphaga sp.]|jgi:mono/diheme cytochrome c family protein|nr:cytochrome [Tardiphaga sp.]
MRLRESRIAAVAVFAFACATPAHAQSPYGIGRTATPAEIAGWNIDVDRDGNNLPPGSGSVSHGHEVFDQQCAGCHGAKGEGGLGDQLVGGQGTIATQKPVRTVGSFWPYAPTLFDYIRRAMPQNAPESLDDNDVYAVSAYVLNLNGLLPADATLEARTLSAIKMPNRNMFVSDPRPDVKNTECITGC